MGYWMEVDSQGRQPLGSGPYPSTCECESGGECLHRNNSNAKTMEVKTVFVSLPPPRGWKYDPRESAGVGSSFGESSTVRTRLARGEEERCMCRERSTTSTRGLGRCCTYNFETGTYVDGDGNEWDPSEFNKRVE